jgi:hypothetical protein
MVPRLMNSRSITSTIRVGGMLLVTAAASFMSQGAHAADICGDGVWVDAMVGSHHIHPKKEFEEFNPGIGVECWVSPSWALTAGYFHDSLSKPSFYGGGVWAPQFVNWRGFVRLAVMGGMISGYNYGKWGIGHNSTVGPVAAPLIMVQYGRVGANIILIPPIPSSDLPFTIGLQVKVRF